MEEIGVHHQFGKDYPQMPMLQVYTGLPLYGKEVDLICLH